MMHEYSEEDHHRHLGGRQKTRRKVEVACKTRKHFMLLYPPPALSFQPSSSPITSLRTYIYTFKALAAF